MGIIKIIMIEVLKGLMSLHQNNIMHRDIKPSNILLDRYGNVKICDFGLARVDNTEDRMKPLTTSVGTKWYKAPELLLGSKAYDRRIDIWALGCVFVEMI